KITPEEESKFKVAKEEEVDRETYWRRFGNCDNLQIFIWFMIGACSPTSKTLHKKSESLNYNVVEQKKHRKSMSHQQLINNNNISINNRKKLNPKDNSLNFEDNYMSL
ncbi:3057_t:CDS:2, partial [Entrophospora sp. SA101]